MPGTRIWESGVEGSDMVRSQKGVKRWRWRGVGESIRDSDIDMTVSQAHCWAVFDYDGSAEQ